MARLLRFKGRPHQPPNDSMKGDPVPGVWYVGDEPTNIPESIPTFREKVFDRALAEACGRTCGPDCDGDCFAEWYAAIGPSVTDQRSRKRDPTLFDCLPWPPDPQPEAPTAPDATSPSAPITTIPETRGTAAKELPDA